MHKFIQTILVTAGIHVVPFIISGRLFVWPQTNVCTIICVWLYRSIVFWLKFNVRNVIYTWRFKQCVSTYLWVDLRKGATLVQTSILEILICTEIIGNQLSFAACFMYVTAWIHFYACLSKLFWPTAKPRKSLLKIELRRPFLYGIKLWLARSGGRKYTLVLKLGPKVGQGRKLRTM